MLTKINRYIEKVHYVKFIQLKVDVLKLFWVLKDVAKSHNYALMLPL